MENSKCSVCGKEIKFVLNRNDNGLCVCNDCMRKAGLNPLWSNMPKDIEQVKAMIENNEKFVSTNDGVLLSLDKVHKLFMFDNQVYDSTNIMLLSLCFVDRRINICGKSLDNKILYTEKELFDLLDANRLQLENASLHIKFDNDDKEHFGIYKNKGLKQKETDVIIKDILTDFILLEEIYGKKIEETKESNDAKEKKNIINYCPKCGCELEDDAKYCRSCGFNLDDINISNKKENTKKHLRYQKILLRIIYVVVIIFNLLLLVVKKMSFPSIVSFLLFVIAIVFSIVSNRSEDELKVVKYSNISLTLMLISVIVNLFIN